MKRVDLAVGLSVCIGVEVFVFGQAIRLSYATTTISTLLYTVHLQDIVLIYTTSYTGSSLRESTWKHNLIS